MVARLTSSKELKDKLVFKGGYVALRIFDSPRYTIDLDATIRDGNINRISGLAKDAIELDLDDGVWFKFYKDLNLETQGEYGGLRLYFRAGIGDVPEKFTKARSIHLDLGVVDSIVPDPIFVNTNSVLDRGTLTWQVYSIELASCEKIHTLLSRMSDNSRSKDIFDLYHFLPKCDIPTLKRSLKETFKIRGDALPGNFISQLDSIEKSQLKRGWNSAVASIGQSIDFDEAFSVICKYIKMLDE